MHLLSKLSLAIFLSVSLITSSVFANPEITHTNTITAGLQDGQRNFRNTTWGMSPAQVRRAETAFFLGQVKGIYVYNGNFAGIPCRIVYKFEQGKLSFGAYFFTLEHSNKNDYIEDFTKVKSSLKSTLGVPALDRQTWQNEQLKTNPSQWGRAVGLGHVSFGAFWMKRDTHIAVLLSGENNAVTHVVAYTSTGIENTTSTSEGGRRALLIGNATYARGVLKNPVNDINAMAQALKASGFSVQKLENANMREMEEGTREFIRSIRPGSVALFYYSGHGMQIDGINYLIPVDFNIISPAEAKYKAYSAQMLVEMMESSGARLNIAILDACRSNPFQSFRGASDGLAPMSGASGTFIGFATAPGGVASDNSLESNGLYTKYLVQAIKSPGLKLEDIFKQVGANVFKESSGMQKPWSTSSVYGDFYFKPSGGVGSMVAATQQQPTTNTETTVESAAEPVKELKLFVTKSGKSYHLEDCRFLKKSKIPTSFAEAKVGYKPCKVCRPPE